MVPKKKEAGPKPTLTRIGIKVEDYEVRIEADINVDAKELKSLLDRGTSLAASRVFSFLSHGAGNSDGESGMVKAKAGTADPAACAYLAPIVDLDGTRWVADTELTRLQDALATGVDPDEVMANGDPDDVLPLAEAARLAGGNPGRFLRHLRACRFELPVSRAMVVHETAPPYAMQSDGNRHRGKTPGRAAGAAVASATDRAVRLAQRGRHASAIRLLTRARRLLEAHIDALLDRFRAVFVLRAVEELTVEETAAALGIADATVRTRYFRASALLRESLARDVDRTLEEAFAFAGERCDRIVARVLERIASGT